MESKARKKVVRKRTSASDSASRESPSMAAKPSHPRQQAQGQRRPGAKAATSPTCSDADADAVGVGSGPVRLFVSHSPFHFLLIPVHISIYFESLTP